MNKIFIAGGGISGLSLGYFLKNNKHKIIEKESFPGGLCRSIYRNQFIFDFTGHLLHFSKKRVKKIIDDLNISMLKHRRKAYILFKNSLIPYPFQANLHYLQNEDAFYALVEFIKKKNIDIKNLEQYFLSSFGKGVYDLFLKPYNRKLWTVDPNELVSDWIGRFVPDIKIDEILKPFFIEKTSNDKGYNKEFFYPEKGINELINKFSEKTKNLNLSEKIIEINWKDKLIVTEKNLYKYDKLVWTLPLKNFLKKARPELPKTLKDSFCKLKAVNIIDLEIGFKGISPEYHWVYIPEKNLRPYRIGCSSNFYDIEKGFFSMYIEISYKENIEVKNIQLKRIVNQLKKVNLIDKNAEIMTSLKRKIKPAYVLYDMNWSNSREKIFKFFKKNSIIPLGRYGKWEYSSIEDAILDAKKLSESNELYI